MQIKNYLFRTFSMKNLMNTLSINSILLLVSLLYSASSFGMAYDEIDPAIPFDKQAMTMSLMGGASKGFTAAALNKKPWNAALQLGCATALCKSLTYPYDPIIKAEIKNRDNYTRNNFQEILSNFLLGGRLIKMAGWGIAAYGLMDEKLPGDTARKSMAISMGAAIATELGAAALGSGFDSDKQSQSLKNEIMSTWYSFASNALDRAVPLRADHKAAACAVGGQLAGAIALNKILDRKLIEKDKKYIRKNGASISTALSNLFIKRRLAKIALWTAYVGAMAAATGSSSLSFERQCATYCLCGVLPELTGSLLSQVAHSTSCDPDIKSIARVVQKNNYIGTASYSLLPYLPPLFAKIAN